MPAATGSTGPRPAIRLAPARSRALARLIAGPHASAHCLAFAAAVAAAQIDVMRARHARCELWPASLVEPVVVRRLAAIDRYEGRALARRQLAIDALETAASSANETNPMQEASAEFG